MKIEAILFDLDGTLVDSIPLYKQAYLKTLNAFGLVLTEQEFNKIYWENWKIPDVIAHFDMSHREVDIRQYRNDLYIKTLGERVTWFEDAKTLLHTLNREMPRAIVTDSWQSFVDAIEQRVDLSSVAPTIITVDECQPYNKPHPYSLLLAAERLGIAPDRCMYVGDQDFDIYAARNAGMADCLIERAHTPPEAGRNATHVIRSLQELPALLAQIK